ncbi:SPOR domain-containing protein [uncultured Polaribacter sp.]|uniref:SPOR domain-containing protein n=1 Tax=uncultured Polaribacter sp. TaxID=174711 RepID=UPI00261D1D50|nr:SPOR domain-containing protein [uncultured Polaribacter sp.]
MKNIFLFILGIFFISCTKNEEKKVIPVENHKVTDTIVSLEKEVLKEDTLIFTVQIAALKNRNEKLADVADINIYEENSLIKYRLGTFETYKEAKNYRLQLLNTYKGAFVQALKNGIPITIKEALQ